MLLYQMFHFTEDTLRGEIAIVSDNETFLANFISLMLHPAILLRGSARRPRAGYASGVIPSPQSGGIARPIRLPSLARTPLTIPTGTVPNRPAFEATLQ